MSVAMQVKPPEYGADCGAPGTRAGRSHELSLTGTALASTDGSWSAPYPPSMVGHKTSVLDAVAQVLEEAGAPLRPVQIAERVLAQGLWSTAGKTPEHTIHARLAMDIKQRGDQSRFVRVAKGVFGLQGQTLSAAGDQAPATVSTLSFTDAAEWVLRSQAAREPMHYRTITQRARASGRLQTGGLTPEQTMYVQLSGEVQRRAKRGDPQRFTKQAKGMFGLAEWVKSGVSIQVEEHNRKVKQELLTRLLDMEAAHFERLCTLLLTKMGLTEVTNTRYSSDGGIDARGTMVVGDVIRTKLAVQIKGWRNNVQAPTVQQLRGALGVHEQGLIITTSSFGKGARDEAGRANASPVGLVDGMQLVSLLIEHGVGVRVMDEAPLELVGEGFDLGQDPEEEGDGA